MTHPLFLSSKLLCLLKPHLLPLALVGALVAFTLTPISTEAADAQTGGVDTQSSLMGVEAASPVLSLSEIVSKVDHAARGTHKAVEPLGLGLSDANWALLLRALIEAESNYDQAAVSRAGAIGLGQLMPQTAKELGVDPHIPDQNLRGASAYLSQNLAAYRSVNLALAAYNAGPGAVAKYGGVPPFAETRSYINRIHKIYARLGGSPLKTLRPVAGVGSTQTAPTRVVLKLEF